MNMLFTCNFFIKCVFRLGKEPCAFKPILKSSIVRCLCSSPMKEEISQQSEKSPKKIDWTPIYHFPYIQMARFANRLKLYQSLFTLVAVPVSVGLYYNGMSHLSSVAVISGSAAFTCVSLYIATSFFKRLIGVIYLSEDKQFVKIAHLTFWGNRKDIVVPIEDLIPLTDGSCKATDAFVKLCRYSTDEVLYLTLRFGKFLDTQNFQEVFGSFEILGLKK